MTLASKSPLVDIGQSKASFRDSLESLYDHVAALLGTAGTAAAAQVALQAFLGAGTVAKTTTTTLTTADRGKVLDCTGTWTLSLPAAATAGNGFCFAVKNSGTGTITVSPSGAELIDEAQVLDGASAIYVCTGARWRVIGGVSGQVPVARGGTGAGTADTACDNLGARRTNAAHGAIGSETIVSQLSSTAYVAGTNYSLAGLSGSWKAKSGCIGSGQDGLGRNLYMTIFTRIS